MEEWTEYYKEERNDDGIGHNSFFDYSDGCSIIELRDMYELVGMEYDTYISRCEL